MLYALCCFYPSICAKQVLSSSVVFNPVSLYNTFFLHLFRCSFLLVMATRRPVLGTMIFESRGLLVEYCLKRIKFRLNHLLCFQDWSCKCGEDCHTVPACRSQAWANWSDHPIWRPESLSCAVHAVQWISSCQFVPGKMRFHISHDQLAR